MRFVRAKINHFSAKTISHVLNRGDGNYYKSFSDRLYFQLEVQ
jgi:hypothetical protein